MIVLEYSEGIGTGLSAFLDQLEQTPPQDLILRVHVAPLYEERKTLEASMFVRINEQSTLVRYVDVLTKDRTEELHGLLMRHAKRKNWKVHEGCRVWESKTVS